MTSSNVRARVVAVEARRVALVLDGLPDRWAPAGVRDRLYRLQAGEEVIVPGWLVGAALGLPVLDRAGEYKLTADDELVPLRGALGRSAGLPVTAPAPSVSPIRHTTYLDRSAVDDQDDDLDEAA